MEEDLRMAEKLDEMEEDVSSAEAAFLEVVLKKLRAEEPLVPREKVKLEAMYKKHIDEGGVSEDDVDEDDFV